MLFYRCNLDAKWRKLPIITEFFVLYVAHRSSIVDGSDHEGTSTLDCSQCSMNKANGRVESCTGGWI